MTELQLASQDLGAAASAVAERLAASVVEVQPASRPGAGAGTIWRASGIIVTNHHVTPGDRARVRLADGRTFDGVVVARDEQSDLAAIQIEANGLPAASIGDARLLRVGALVLAIGHPFGMRGAVSIGVVQATLATGEESRELIRADLLLGPGNSGGPLADASGRVVGLNAMVSGGLALAVPSHLVERMLSADKARLAA